MKKEEKLVTIQYSVPESKVEEHLIRILDAAFDHFDGLMLDKDTLLSAMADKMYSETIGGIEDVLDKLHESSAKLIEVMALIQGFLDLERAKREEKINNRLTSHQGDVNLNMEGEEMELPELKNEVDDGVEQNAD